LLDAYATFLMRKGRSNSSRVLDRNYYR